MVAVRYHGPADLLERTTPARHERLNDCLEWNGARFDKGYGAVTWRGRRWRAHRLMWRFLHGELPDGIVIRHQCDNPPCINPEHLLAGTQGDNMVDKFSRQRHPDCGKYERTPEVRNRMSAAAKRRWESMSADERDELSRAMGRSRLGKPRGPYRKKSNANPSG